ncbi:MAG: ATP-binding protein [Alphaproteobacteria bacterium]
MSRTAVAAPAAADATAPPPGRRLFRKYALLFIGLVAAALLITSGFDFWFSYQETKAALVRLQQEKAVAAADRIEGFVEGIEQHIGWTTHAQWAASPLDQRRQDYFRLLRQVPAITEVRQLDAAGREQLKISRLAMDAVGSAEDLSQHPAFRGAKTGRVWFSPVYFRKQSEPYVAMAMAHQGRNAGVTIAEINLKLIWDVITDLKIGQTGYAYIVEGNGRLIAHPDISLVLRGTDLSGLPQVAAALASGGGASDAADDATVAENLAGKPVLSTNAPISRLGWLVFVEAPLSEAFAPLHGAALRTGFLLLCGLAAAILLALVLARRMTGPIHAIAEGAERFGAGDFGRRIDVQTGDELETLAGQFNRMAADLQKSYAELEQRVADRTAELSEALEQQTATAEVLRVINSSPGDLAPVFEAVLERATRVCQANYGNLYTHDGVRFHSAAIHGPADFVEWRRQRPTYEPKAFSTEPLARIAAGEPLIAVDDMRVTDAYSNFPLFKELVDTTGLRSLVTVALRRDDTLLGAITVYRTEIRPFTNNQIALVQNFAAQAVIAMENARLLNELRARTDELARSVEELKALSEVGQAVSSTLDIGQVLSTILNRSVALTASDAGAIFRHRRRTCSFRLFEAVGWDAALTASVRKLDIPENVTTIGDATARRISAQIPDMAERAGNPLRDMTLAAGYRSVLIVPLVGPDRIFGAIVLQRRLPGEFPEASVRLMQTLASQSVLAIQNARLFREIAEKSEQLAEASRHKSQFLANMSHELRTPLNAILGYTELMADGIYGELAPRAAGVLERVQNNGKHLLALINDVLDLAKIEAGQLVFTLEDYSLADVVQSVVSATEGLARNKGLELTAEVAPGLPTGHADARRLQQVLLNLVGNAVKFTDDGEVAIQAAAENGNFVLTVRDTGPGIAAEDHSRIFGEFQQVDNSNTRKKGGTGLGLAISQRIIEMQGGTISVDSELGNGATFRVVLPIRVEDILEEAASVASDASGRNVSAALRGAA